MVEYYSFLLQPAGLPCAFFRISHCYRYQVSILWMPGRSSFLKKTHPNKPFLVSSSFSVHLYFVWSKILGQGWSGTCSVSLGVSLGQPSWCLLWWQPSVSFQPGRYQFPLRCWNCFLQYKYLKVFHAGGEIWTQGQMHQRCNKASDAWGLLPSSVLLQRNLGFKPWRDELLLRKCFRLKCLFISAARASWSVKLFCFCKESQNHM